MNCKLLLAIGRGGRDIVALCATGAPAEWDFDFALQEGGLRYDDVLGGQVPHEPGLYVWEGRAEGGEDGIEYFQDTYRKLTPEELALLATGTVQLWPRGPNSDPHGEDDDKEGPEVGGFFA